MTCAYFPWIVSHVSCPIKATNFLTLWQWNLSKTGLKLRDYPSVDRQPTQLTNCCSQRTVPLLSYQQDYTNSASRANSQTFNKFISPPQELWASLESSAIGLTLHVPLQSRLFPFLTWNVSIVKALCSVPSFCFLSKEGVWHLTEHVLGNSHAEFRGQRSAWYRSTVCFLSFVVGAIRIHIYLYFVADARVGASWRPKSTLNFKIMLHVLKFGVKTTGNTSPLTVFWGNLFPNLTFGCQASCIVLPALCFGNISQMKWGTSNLVTHFLCCSFGFLVVLQFSRNQIPLNHSPRIATGCMEQREKRTTEETLKEGTKPLREEIAKQDDFPGILAHVVNSFGSSSCCMC